MDLYSDVAPILRLLFFVFCAIGMAAVGRSVLQALPWPIQLGPGAEPPANADIFRYTARRLERYIRETRGESYPSVLLMHRTWPTVENENFLDPEQVARIRWSKILQTMKTGFEQAANLAEESVDRERIEDAVRSKQAALDLWEEFNDFIVF